MHRGHITSRIIRDRAFALAVATCPPDRRALIIPRATEFRRYLLWCTSQITPIGILRRVVVAAIMWQLRAECSKICLQLAVMRCLIDPNCAEGDLIEAIRVEVEARYEKMLGEANNLATRSVLHKLSDLPAVQEQLATALRERRADVVSGKVVVQFRTRVATIIALYLIALGWIALVFSQVPDIRNNGASATMATVVVFAMLTFLFSPAIRAIGADKKLRDTVNGVPHIQ